MRRRIALDTSAYSHFRANHATVLEWLAAAESVLIPTVVIGELCAGFQLGRRTKENHVVLSEFLAEPNEETGTHDSYAVTRKRS